MMKKVAMPASRKEASLFGWIPGLFDSTGEDLFLGDLLRLQSSSDKSSYHCDGIYHSDTVTTTMESDDSSDEEEASSSSTNNSVDSYGTALTSSIHDGESPDSDIQTSTTTKQNQPKRRYPRSPYSKRSRHYPDPIRITVY